MSGIVFLKKEFREIFKTQKIFVLPAVFLFFGFLSALTAKMLPQLMQEMAKSYGQQPMAVKEAKYLDAYAQLFKNVSQLMFVVILVFAGMVVGEKVKGTAALVLTKPVSRTQFVLAKFVSALSLYTFAYLLSVGACIYYTYILFPQFYNERLILSLFMLWMSGAFFVALTIFASTLGKTYVISAVSGIGGYILLLISVIIPYVSKFTPGNIGNIGLNILNGDRPISDFAAPTITAVVLSALLIYGSIALLKKQEI